MGAAAAAIGFVYALSVDRNEIDGLGPYYLILGGVCTGLGALTGWAVDAAISKPRLTYDVTAGRGRP